MIKLIRNMVACLSCAIVIGIAAPVTASAASEIMNDIPVDASESILIDQADVLSDSEEKKLTAEIQATAEYIDMNILVYVSGTAIGGSDYRTQMFCEELCFDYYDRNADSVVLYMDLAGHGDTSYAPFDFIYTRNRARFYYPSDTDDAEDRISSIFSRMNTYLPRGGEQPYPAIEQFLSGLKGYYDKGVSNLKYFYVRDTGKYVTMNSAGELILNDSRPKNWGKGFLIGIFISLIVSIITFFCIKHQYKFKSAPSSLHYLRSENVLFGDRSDIFIRKYQIRTKRQTSSSGGGGGGGGTSSGGGGGGNHR